MHKPARTLLITVCSIALLCACTKNSKDPQPSTLTEQNTTAGSQTNQYVETSAAQGTLPLETTLPPATSDTGTTGQSTGGTLPSTTAEIVSFFNEAANRVKQTKPGYKFSSKASADKKNIAVSDNVPFHSVIASFAASSINSTKTDDVIVKKGASHDDFPVKGQPWASMPDASALISASSKENGNYYEIELKFKDEKLPALPEKNNTTAHGKAFSLLLNEEFRSQFGGFDTKLMGINIRVDNQKFEPTYKGSTIKCKIDKAGNMISAVYYLNTSSDVDMLVKVNKKDYLIGIKLEYSMTETYTIG